MAAADWLNERQSEGEVNMWETEAQRCLMICLMSLKKTVIAQESRSLECCLNSISAATYPYDVTSNTAAVHMSVGSKYRIFFILDVSSLPVLPLIFRIILSNLP